MITVTSGPDAGLAWHYGDPMGEQRALTAGHGRVDLSNRAVVTVSGPDRLSWLHALTTQSLEKLAPGSSTAAFVLDPNGRIEYALAGFDDGETFWAHTAAETASPLVEWLNSMRFALRVEVAARPDVAVIWGVGEPLAVPVVRRWGDTFGGWEAFVPRADLASFLGDVLAGTWAYDALRIAAGVPRVGVDTDARTIPNEIAMPDGPLLGMATHLEKGCYRGQETVAKVHSLGRPPRRLARLQLDGSLDELPAVGAELVWNGKPAGFVGSSSRHYEQGPIALALVKRAVPVDAVLEAGGIPATQEPLVDPEVGLHFRANLR